MAKYAAHPLLANGFAFVGGQESLAEDIFYRGKVDDDAIDEAASEKLGLAGSSYRVDHTCAGETLR
ncbi:MAG: hypothetical protein M3082_04005 [Candidatus Dormibacteraeota bacterium]|nr:hypothetical protein [Candidatus Dormibacteraeota bacterium]